MEFSFGGVKEGSNWFEVDEILLVWINCDEVKNVILFDDFVEFLLIIFDCEIFVISVMVFDVIIDGGMFVVIVVIFCLNGDEEWLLFKIVCVNVVVVDWVLIKRVELKFFECEVDVIIEVIIFFGCNVVVIDVDWEIVDIEGFLEELRLKLFWDIGVLVIFVEFMCDDDLFYLVVVGCEVFRRVLLILFFFVVFFLCFLVGLVDDEIGIDNDWILFMVEGKLVV